MNGFWGTVKHFPNHSLGNIHGSWIVVEKCLLRTITLIATAQSIPRTVVTSLPWMPLLNQSKCRRANVLLYFHIKMLLPNVDGCSCPLIPPTIDIDCEASLVCTHVNSQSTSSSLAAILGKYLAGCNSERAVCQLAHQQWSLIAIFNRVLQKRCCYRRELFGFLGFHWNLQLLPSSGENRILFYFE